MSFSLMSVVIDAADLDEESRFWHGLLGGTITRSATDHFVQVEGLAVIVVHHAPGQRPPQWPDGADQQLHLDLATADLEGADQRVIDAGGRRLRPTGPTASGHEGSSQVYASPAGHPFCLRAAR